MTKKELVKLIPFGIACILFLTYAIQVLLMPSHINEEGNEVTYSMVDSVKYAGFGLAIVLTLILVKKPVWKYAFAILTILAFSEYINFYPNTFSFGIGIISFELTALSLLIFHLALNPEVFQSFKGFIKPKPESEESKESKFESAVNGFETRFNKKSTDELRNIVEQNSLVPEAVEAAKRLLERR
ncbi:hypothetical protein N6H18_12615 [Reichenbachiella agarivorans]|uniref:Uncharacterized protein n=1 Tax=Reichenbachiella agarivorans TaxID=2979464 RepID=A0ABY6CKY8_9BACT|nr:hypothetical protein [Reichenbachiella agarivorans]UXP31191.1 hypothetical protein N6H18_12615 [Reichenbachiella agarivorans]